ncbi:hypothetical protein ACE3MS_00020 [Paenibacillus dendritiformis]|uniref:hypothetical protein n=1 Tax=Paenibacillus dendritiformis TaxID=130049 RepID=UPI0036515982
MRERQKYEFTGEATTDIAEGAILHRIRAVRDFGNVKAGDLGGWIESEKNLGHGGHCWVYDNAAVFGRASVLGYASIRNGAMVYDRAFVYGEAIVDNSDVFGSATIAGCARVEKRSSVYRYALIAGTAELSGAEVGANVEVHEGAMRDLKIMERG